MSSSSIDYNTNKLNNLDILKNIQEFSDIKNISDYINIFLNKKYWIRSSLDSSNNNQEINLNCALIFKIATGCYNHHHVLLEYINILFIISNVLSKYIDLSNTKIPIFFDIPVNSKEWVKTECTISKYIDYYNLPFNYTINLNNNLYLNTKILFLINKHLNVTHLSGQFLNFLRSKMLKSIISNKKIVINRQKDASFPYVSTRLFSDRFIQQLKNIGYEYHELENYSLQAQVDLFNSASHIVCAHGAALTNLVYCQNNTKIIEINPGFNPTCYTHLSKFLYKKTGINTDYYSIFDNFYYQNTKIIPNLQVNRYDYPKHLIQDEDGVYREILNRDLFTNKNPIYIQCDIKKIQHLL